MRKAWPVLLAAVLYWASPSLAAEDVPLGEVWLFRGTCLSEIETSVTAILAAAEKLTNITWSNPQWNQNYKQLCTDLPTGACPERRRMLRWASREARALLATEDCKKKRVFFYMEATPANPVELHSNLKSYDFFSVDWLRELLATTRLTTTKIDWRSGQPGNIVGTETAILPSRLPTSTESGSSATPPSPAQASSPSPAKSPAPSASPSPAKASPPPASLPASSPPLVRASTITPSPSPGKGSTSPPSPSKSIGSTAPQLSPPPAAKSSPLPPPPPPAKPGPTVSPPAPYDYPGTPPNGSGEDLEGGGGDYPPPPSGDQPPAPTGSAPSPPYLSPPATTAGPSWTPGASAVSPPPTPTGAPTQGPSVAAPQPPEDANVAGTGVDSSSGGGGGGLSNGVIVAIVIGAVVALALAAGTAAMCFAQNQRVAREKLNTELAAYRFKRATQGGSMSHSSSNFDRWEMLKESHAVTSAELEQRTFSMKTRGGQALSTNTSWTERSREPAPSANSTREPAPSAPSVRSYVREAPSPPVTSYFARAPAPEAEHEINLEEERVLSPSHSRSSHPETSPFSEKKSSNFFGRISKKNLG